MRGIEGFAGLAYVVNPEQIRSVEIGHYRYRNRRFDTFFDIEVEDRPQKRLSRCPNHHGTAQPLEFA